VSATGPTTQTLSCGGSRCFAVSVTVPTLDLHYQTVHGRVCQFCVTCPTPGTCDLVLCFFLFFNTETRQNYFYNVDFLRKKEIWMSIKKRWRGLSDLPTLQTNTPWCVLRPLSRVPFRSWGTGGTSNHDEEVLKRIIKTQTRLLQPDLSLTE
jgi:hypothetical protein